MPNGKIKNPENAVKLLTQLANGDAALILASAHDLQRSTKGHRTGDHPAEGYYEHSANGKTGRDGKPLPIDNNLVVALLKEQRFFQQQPSFVDTTQPYEDDTDPGAMPGEHSAVSDSSAPRTPSKELAIKTGQKEAARQIKSKLTRSNSLLDEGKQDESQKNLQEALELHKVARQTYPDWDKDVWDEQNMSIYKKGENSVVYKHPLNSGSLVKIMNKSEAELNETMGKLKIGPNVKISARKDSNGKYNVAMTKLKGETLEKLWPKMEYEEKKNAVVQMKAIIEKAGDAGYKLTDNNPANFILNNGKITRIDFDDAHVKKIAQGGKEKAVGEALRDAYDAFEMPKIDENIWQYLPKESSSPGF